MSNVIDVIASNSPGCQMHHHIRCFPQQNTHYAQLVRVFVARSFRLPVAALLAPTRGSGPVSHARQVAMYLTHVVFSVPLAHVAAAFGRDRSTASHACKVVEWQRDNPVFDHFLAHLEWHLLVAVSNAAQLDVSSKMAGEGA